MKLTVEDSPIWVYDIEIFPNYFLATFYNGEKWLYYEDPSILAALLYADKLVLAGFNNLSYDDIVLCEIAKNPKITCEELYRLSCTLVADESRDLIFALKYQKKPWRFSIDVFQLFNGKGSLKEWECKRGAKLVAETPCDFNKPVEPSDIPIVRKYCENDVIETYHMLRDNFELVTLRTKLKSMYDLMDLVYAMSEQSVAQHTFLTLHRHRTGEVSSMVRENASANLDNIRSAFSFSEILSNKLQYDSEPFNTFYNNLFAGCIEQDEKGTWNIHAPDISDTIHLADRDFAFGVGGIHSVDGPAIIESDDQHLIVDLDVASYYPSIIINERLYPRHMGEGFIDDMRSLRDERLKAKRAGDKVVANALKIVINATFGKLDDSYSPIRSVPDAKRVTINGQMFILMLIEDLYLAGATIVSANTDGVTIRWTRTEIDSKLKQITSAWESHTGYELERTDYSKYIRRDINNYIAVYTPDPKGKVKTKLKGCFEACPAGAGKWDGMIIKRAAVAFLTQGTPIAETVRSSTSPADFLFYQRIKNGGMAYYDRQVIGKSIRWYAAICGGKIQRYNPNAKEKKDGTINYYSQIPHGESAMLANDITGWDTIPCDVDYDYYIEQAEKLVRSVTNA